MEYRLSERVLTMAVSATLAMTAKARALRTQGKDIINLSLGEPDFNTPEFIKTAAEEAIRQNYNSYSPVDGYADLKEAIAKKFKRDNNLNYDITQIVVSTGAKQSLANLALALLNPGDEVILPAPYWVSYFDIVKLAQGIPIEVPTTIEHHFKITPKQLEAAITPKTKLLLYSSPCNPTGSVYSKEELEDLAEVLKKYPHIYVVSDEIYEHINFTKSHVSMAAIEEMYERTITVNGVSKTFAMTGWRIGYIGAPKPIAEACTKIQGQVTSGASSIAQRAAIAALNAPVSNITYMIDEFHKRRDLIFKLLSEVRGFKLDCPEGAFYVFPDIGYFLGKTIKGRKINTAFDFSMLLLEEAYVATVTGEAFGNKSCIRISYAASEKEIIEAVDRIKRVLS
jgi:aspartate aminotransferase